MSPQSETPVALAIGTHTWTTDEEGAAKVDKIISLARQHKITVLDTARYYGVGESETVIGNKGLPSEFAITTKVPTGMGIPNVKVGEKIEEFAKQSFDALKTDKIRTNLFHAPDEEVPVSVQVDAMQKLYEQGRFEEWGLSNFSREQVLEYYNYAKAKNYILPSVFQCSYSLAVRRNETALFPTLRELGFRIQAYSPMAAGFLAKTPEYVEEGRGQWDPATLMGRFFRNLYYKPSLMKMLRDFGELAEKSGVSRMGLAYRWVRYHSALRHSLGDEMIIGATRSEQFEESVLELEKGPLEDWVVEKIEQLWGDIKDEAPIDNLDSIKKIFGGSG